MSRDNSTGIRSYGRVRLKQLILLSIFLLTDSVTFTSLDGDLHDRLAYTTDLYDFTISLIDKITGARAVEAMDIFCLHDFGQKHTCLGQKTPGQSAVSLDIFFDYAVAPYLLNLHAHAKCACDRYRRRSGDVVGRAVFIFSSVHFFYLFSSPLLTSRRFGFGIGVHLESGRVVWRSVYHIILWSQFTYLVRLRTSGGTDLNHIGSGF